MMWITDIYYVVRWEYFNYCDIHIQLVVAL